MSSRIERSVCPYDCPDTCGLLVEVENDKVISVKGDPEHPVTRGSLCHKMNHYEKTIHSPRRLIEPLERCGPKGSGKFRPISWDKAISTITERWQQIISEFGAEAILPYSYAGTMGIVQRNAGHPFFHRMGASLLERGICTPAKGAGWDAVMGKTPAPAPDEVVHSDLVILWSSNAAATNIHFLQLVKEAKKRGSQVWMIDLYRNQTAGLADRTLLVNPGTDTALALGLMHILVRDNLCDQDFIDQHVQGFAELCENILPAYPPQIVSEITGLSSNEIEDLAQAYGTATAPFISIGGGVSRYANGAMSVRSIVTLPALVGAWDKPGAGCFVGTSTSAAFDMSQIERFDLLQGSPRTINMSCLGGALTQLNDPPIKSLYIYHSNPAAVAPDQTQVLAGLTRDDLFSVVHERFMTDSALYADIVLPAVSSVETSDIYRAYGSYTVQRSRKLIPNVGQSKSNIEVFSLLAKGMDYTEACFDQNAEERIDQLCAVQNSWWKDIDKSALTAGKAVKLSPPRPKMFVTPSAKIEILNPTQNEPLPIHIPPTDNRFPLQLVTAPAHKTLNSTFFERADLRENQMKILINPQEAQRRNLNDGALVNAFNDLGAVDFYLQIDERVPAGLAVAEGVWWIEFAPGEKTVNSLTSQQLTDQGGGSTFYDNRIELRASNLRSKSVFDSLR